MKYYHATELNETGSHIMCGIPWDVNQNSISAFTSSLPSGIVIEIWPLKRGLLKVGICGRTSQDSTDVCIKQVIFIFKTN